jgi:uncharacterized alkaline shock family protein YloU
VEAKATPLGRITIADGAIAQVVARTVARCYGVVGTAPRGRVPRALTPHRERQGIEISREGDAVSVGVHVVVEHGLNLAEVGSTIRSQVGYEVERITGLRVAAVDVHIEAVKTSA